MTVRAAPRNAMRDKTGKKAVRMVCSPSLSVFCILVCPFGYWPSDSPRLTRNKAKALRYSVGPIRAETLLLQQRRKGFLLLGNCIQFLGGNGPRCDVSAPVHPMRHAPGPGRSVRRVGRLLKICDHENLSPRSEVLVQRITQDEARQYRSKVATLYLNSTRICPTEPNHL